MVEWLWNLIFPPKCPGCNCYVERRGQWCPSCLDRICRPHLLPLDGEMAAIFAGGIWALGIYEGELRNMLRQLKYQQKRAVVPGLHHLVAEGLKAIQLRRDNPFLSDFMVVPVPLHRKKLAQRGFNQSKVIFQQPLESMGAIVQDCLLRTRDTKPQYGLSGIQRRENLQQAFVLAEPQLVQGQKVLLVDDIMTTGATMLECAKILQKAGVTNMMGLVVASGRK